MVVIEALLLRFQPSFLQLWARILRKLPLVLGDRWPVPGRDEASQLLGRGHSCLGISRLQVRKRGFRGEGLVPPGVWIWLKAEDRQL